MSGAFFCSICFEAGSNSAYFFQVNDMCDPVTSPTLLCIFHFRPKCSKELCFLIDLTLHKWKSEVDTSPPGRPLFQTFPSTYSQTNIRIEYTSQEVYVSKLLQYIFGPNQKYLKCILSSLPKIRGMAFSLNSSAKKQKTR